MQETHKVIKVLIVDDSMVIRKLLANIIQEDPRLMLIGEACNGKEAIQKVQQLKPDIVSMDIQMPLMTGVEVTRYLMQHHPVPILIASSFYRPTDQVLVMEVLEAGAVGILMKPTGPGHPEHDLTKKKYLTMLRSLAEVKVVRRRLPSETKPIQQIYDRQPVVSKPSGTTANKILVIGASAGGPEALKQLLGGLLPDLPIPVLLVQHIDAHFSEGFCQWLQTYTPHKVVFNSEQQTLEPGVIYIAPPGFHTEITGTGMAGLSQQPPEGGHRPSVGPLFRSASMHYGDKVIGVILSGMGSDGARDLLRIKMAGGMTLVQNKESCLVFGMPGEAVKLGAARFIDTPLNIAKRINLYLTEHSNTVSYE